MWYHHTSFFHLEAECMTTFFVANVAAVIFGMNPQFSGGWSTILIVLLYYAYYCKAPLSLWRKGRYINDYYHYYHYHCVECTMLSAIIWAYYHFVGIISHRVGLFEYAIYSWDGLPYIPILPYAVVNSSERMNSMPKYDA